MTTRSSFTKELRESKLFLLVDIEATCWERHKVRDKNEIIELGAILCNTDGYILGSYQSFVRPRINKSLSKFCKELTNISQSDIETSEVLSSIVEKMIEWADNNFAVDLQLIKWASWGNWDEKCLKKDCKRHDIPFPFGQHICLKALYKELRGLDCGLKEAVDREGFYWSGKEHRALDDAFNSHKIAKLLIEN